MQICCHFRSRQPGWERCRNRLPRRGSHIPLPRARPFRRDLSVHDKAGERAFHRTLSAPKGHSSPFRHLCVQGTAAPVPPPCTLAKCAAPYGRQTAHLLSVLPPHNTCPPRKAKAPFSAISTFPHKSYSAASPQFSPSRKCASARERDKTAPPLRSQRENARKQSLPCHEREIRRSSLRSRRENARKQPISCREREIRRHSLRSQRKNARKRPLPCCEREIRRSS